MCRIFIIICEPDEINEEGIKQSELKLSCRLNCQVDVWRLFLQIILKYFEDDLYSKVDNLHSTDDGEPSEEAHGASDS